MGEALLRNIPETLRTRVLDDLTGLVVITGTMALASAAVRDLSLGKTPSYMWPAAVCIGLVYGLHLARRKIPPLVRSTALLTSLSLLPFLGAIAYGINSPSLLILPLALLLSRVLFGPRPSWMLAGALLVLFSATAAWLTIHGPYSNLLRTDTSRHPTSWIHLAMLFTFMAATLILIVKRFIAATMEGSVQANQERTRISTILQGIPDGLLVLDLTHSRIEDLNPAMRALAGGGDFDPSSVPLQDFLAHIPVSVAEALRKVVGDPGSLNLFSLDLPQGPRWVEASASLLDVESGRKSILTFRDVTEAVQEELEITAIHQDLEAKVEENIVHLRRAHSQMETITAAISGDLRRRIQCISKSLEDIQFSGTESPPDKGCEFLERAKASAGRGERLVEALCEMARTDTPIGKESDLDMYRLASEACSLQTARILREGADPLPVVTIDEHLPPVRADADLVGDLWSSLIGHSFGLLASQGGTLHIGWESSPHGPWFTITDESHSIALAESSQLFRIFHPSVLGASERTERGLAMIRRTLQLSGGELTVRSRPGEGPLFRFRLGPPKSPASPGEPR
ncbi:MAG: PAS domain-containing sensor histidine kinase [Fibrobacteria bacterium]|nr:PAS domain-containing sensor histidine kinase [Fibrobacteria bacterium]